MGEGEGRRKDEAHIDHLSPTASVSFFHMFRYADIYDFIFMAFGFIGAVGDGATIPGTTLLVAKFINIFETRDSYGKDEYMHNVRKFAVYFLYVGMGAFIACLLEGLCWMRTGERQASRLRSTYLRAVLRQDVGFFDSEDNITARVIGGVSMDTLQIQNLLSEKVPHFTVNISSFVAGLAVAFYFSWRLGVVSLAFFPLLVIPGLLYGKTLMGLMQSMQIQYTKAGSVAEQALASIRTVYSFVGESKVAKEFTAALEGVVKLDLRQGLAKGLATGSTGLMYGIWAFMAWYGSTLVMNHNQNGGNILAGGYGVMNGGLCLGAALPDIKYFAEARLAISRIISMIKRIPAIDSDDLSGRTIEVTHGKLELRNIDFEYPSRPGQLVLVNFGLIIPAGKTVALVGSSGSGKSTIISLLERFYDSSCGEILLDDINIKELQLKWLRRQMGLVSQEPVLFSTSIKDNILFGKEDASMEEIISATIKANVHDFISQLPNGYDTQVGERGIQLSGGQKQRIAIARALIKNPPILLLDEATSALDAESERAVQQALDKASLGRTTVIVAHRLSTIRHSDLIAVIQGGQVVEMGKHDELLQKSDGAYSILVQLQQQQSHEQEQKTEQELPRISLAGSNVDSKCSETLDKRPSMKDFTTKAPSLHRLLALNAPEWKQAALGCLGASSYGIVDVLYAFAWGSMATAFFLKDHEEIKRRIRIYSGIFTAAAVICFVVNLIQHSNFSAMGAYLTRRIRLQMFEKILSFEIGWFDQEENSTGAVCSRLIRETNVVRSLVGDRLSLLLQTASHVVAACVLSVAVAWRLGLLMIAIQPLFVVGQYVAKAVLKAQNQRLSRAQDKSSQLAAEAVGNHKTVTAFSSQNKIFDVFTQLQAFAHKEASTQSWVAGIGLGSATFILYAMRSLFFWYGGKLINEGRLSGGNFFKALVITISTGRVIADAWSMSSDIAKGSSAVASVFSVLDRESLISPDDQRAETLEKIEGNVEFSKVDFAYPTRPELMILKKFNLKVKAGKSVALVGESGCGKSTVIGLIERFYDPWKGKVRIDGKDIKQLHLRTLRKYIGLVSQEPTLFSGTIAENIMFGKNDATEAEMIEATKAANAHDFISALKDGYKTNAGEKGLQLSGGQKQRIAIARAILKNPAILLLDEATSALDAQSESIVQEAVDRMMAGRTTIVVAHRLTTIQRCDSIVVIQDGSVIEQGRQAELLAKGEEGAYFKLVQLQHHHLTN